MAIKQGNNQYQYQVKRPGEIERPEEIRRPARRPNASRSALRERFDGVIVRGGMYGGETYADAYEATRCPEYQSRYIEPPPRSGDEQEPIGGDGALSGLLHV